VEDEKNTGEKKLDRRNRKKNKKRKEENMGQGEEKKSAEG
jgi:hypothetical protein